MNIPVIDWFMSSVCTCVQQPREEVGGEEVHSSITDSGSKDVHSKAVDHVAQQP